MLDLSADECFVQSTPQISQKSQQYCLAITNPPPDMKGQTGLNCLRTQGLQRSPFEAPARGPRSESPGHGGRPEHNAGHRTGGRSKVAGVRHRFGLGGDTRSASCVRILAHFIEAYLGQSVHCRSNDGGPRSGPHVWRRVWPRARAAPPTPAWGTETAAHGALKPWCTETTPPPTVEDPGAEVGGWGSAPREAGGGRAAPISPRKHHFPPFSTGMDGRAGWGGLGGTNLALDMRTRPRPPVV